MEQKVKPIFIGEIAFDEQNITVIDPCHKSEDGILIPIMPGTYNCYVSKEKDDLSGYVVVANRIVLASVSDDGEQYADQEWSFIDCVGVDAGLAGFFQNKPDFSREEWSSFCETLGEIEQAQSRTASSHTFFYDNATDPTTKGYFTYSGYGDGEYEVYGVLDDETGTYKAVEILFI